MSVKLSEPEGIQPVPDHTQRISTGTAPNASLNRAYAEAHVGDSLSIASGAAVRIEVRVPFPLPGGRVDLVHDSVVVDSAPIPSAAPPGFERRIAKAGYLRVHVHAADGAPVAVTNPVYLEVAARR